MVKNYLPSIPITVPGSTIYIIKDNLAQEELNKKNQYKIIFFKKNKMMMKSLIMKK